ncbi:MAG: hypothetical protein ACREGC_01085, partial [Minisyncoccia bacterium]
KDVVKRSRVSSDSVRRELRMLASVNFIRKRSKGWAFNPTFKYAPEMEALIISAGSLNNETIANIFKKVGRVKLLVTSGVFIKNHDSRVDLLVVGDKMKKNRIEEGVHKLEAELGTELVYATFNTKEFIYRLNMYDKLVRDILDYPHEVILETKELSTQALKKV